MDYRYHLYCSPGGRPTVVAERLEKPLVTKQVAEFDKVLETAKKMR